MNYTIEVAEKPNRPGTWDSLVVTILGDGEKIGSYTRNYSSMMNTFVPFTQNGNDYALYSKDYTATRVMRLPSCEDLCGEERETWGFCPVDFYVPESNESGDGIDGTFGFVAGCVWGDDSSWKIQFLDLSRIEEGILKRDDRFGYIELPTGVSLEDCVSLDGYYVGKLDMGDGEIVDHDEPYIQIAEGGYVYRIDGKPINTYCLLSHRTDLLITELMGEGKTEEEIIAEVEKTVGVKKHVQSLIKWIKERDD